MTQKKKYDIINVSKGGADLDKRTERKALPAL